jgi:acyl carrier protein
MSNEVARELVRGALELPALLETIRDDEDLLAAGVNSGELIVVAVRCEERLGRALTDSEMSSLVSIDAVAQILGEKHGTT